MNFYLFMQIGGLLASSLFLFFGVNAMVLAYRSTDPFMFLALFFSSSFIILLSAAMGAVFVFRMLGFFGYIRRNTGGPSDEGDEG